MPITIYTGKAGELAARSEFLLLGYNVAVPDVDVGNDLFVVEDRTGIMWRVQVKTATGRNTADGHSGLFSIPLAQLRADPTPIPLVFIFALRISMGRWEFVVIPQNHLLQDYEDFQVGTPLGRHLQLLVEITPAEVSCSGRSWQRYRNRFDLQP